MPVTHQDLGQMQMYVNYFDRNVNLTDENPSVGILLCKRKKGAIVELTLPRDANIHARGSTCRRRSFLKGSFSSGPANRRPARNGSMNLAEKELVTQNGEKSCRASGD